MNDVGGVIEIISLCNRWEVLVLVLAMDTVAMGKGKRTGRMRREGCQGSLCGVFCDVM